MNHEGITRNDVIRYHQQDCIIRTKEKEYRGYVNFYDGYITVDGYIRLRFDDIRGLTYWRKFND